MPSQASVCLSTRGPMWPLPMMFRTSLYTPPPNNMEHGDLPSPASLLVTSGVHQWGLFKLVHWTSQIQPPPNKYWHLVSTETRMVGKRGSTHPTGMLYLFSKIFAPEKGWPWPTEGLTAPPPCTGSDLMLKYRYNLSCSVKTYVSQFLPSATKLRRLCFYRRLSVHRGGGWGCLPQCMLAYHTPREQTPLGADTPREQTPPLEQTPPRADDPLEQTPLPPSRYPPPPEIRSLLRTIRILLECILVLEKKTFVR